MPDASRFLYAISHLAAIATLVCPGLWRRFPICLLMISVSSIMAFTYAPESRDWVRNVYMNLEPLAVALRLGAAFEVIHRTAGRCKDRTLLLFGLMSFAVSVVASIWVIEPGSSDYTFVQYRRYIQIFTATLMMGALVFFVSQKIWRWDLTGLHFLILFVLTLKQAVYSVLSIRGIWTTNSRWQAADWPGLLISSLCLLSWSALAIASSRPYSSGTQAPSNAG